MRMKLDISGDDHMKNSLRKLGITLKERILSKVITEVGAPIVAEAKALVPVSKKPADGIHIRDDIIIKVKHYRNKQTVVAIIGAEWPRGNPAYPLEKGHRTVKGGTLDRDIVRLDKDGKAYRSRTYKGTGGTVTGYVEPRPFLEPAFDRHRGNFAANLSIRLRQEIEAAIG